MIKLMLRVVSIVILLGAAYFVYTLFEVYSFGQHNYARPVRAEVVLGAAEYDGIPSDVLRARLDHALVLFKEGFAKEIITTGGSQKGDVYNEAEVGARYLRSKGVPYADVIAVPTGNDTYQSMAVVADVLRSMHLTSAIFVSNRFHEYRVRGIAESLGITDYSSPVTASPIHGKALLSYYLREALAVSAGKLVGYKLLSILRHGS
ncbi:MAG: YdcF family protein [Nitrospiraceae bacterium]|nr:YdcF family protein [Nitrospiraceae bacterium]